MTSLINFDLPLLLTPVIISMSEMPLALIKFSNHHRALFLLIKSIKELTIKEYLLFF